MKEDQKRHIQLAKKVVNEDQGFYFWINSFKGKNTRMDQDLALFNTDFSSSLQNVTSYLPTILWFSPVVLYIDEHANMEPLFNSYTPLKSSPII